MLSGLTVLPHAIITLKDSSGRTVNTSKFSFSVQDVKKQIQKLHKFALVRSYLVTFICNYEILLQFVSSVCIGMSIGRN